MEYSENIPIQYQEGKCAFLGMDVMVDWRVLIPRPETELLVTVTRDLCREKLNKAPLILDVGTGSGNISLGLVKLIDDCCVIGTDICKDALNVTRENLKRFGYEGKVRLIDSNMFSEFYTEKHDDIFDCIVSNPPYVSKKDYEELDAWVKAEPKKALYAGEEGMDYLNIIAEESSKFLSPGGFVAVEIGYDQALKVKKKFNACGFANITSFRDFNNYERIVVGWKHG